MTTCFNEAAGIPRGKRLCERAAPRIVLSRFNEAAGIPRGKRASLEQ